MVQVATSLLTIHSSIDIASLCNVSLRCISGVRCVFRIDYQVVLIWSPIFSIFQSPVGFRLGVIDVSVPFSHFIFLRLGVVIGHMHLFRYRIRFPGVYNNQINLSDWNQIIAPYTGLFLVTFSGASGTLNTGSGTLSGNINARSDPEG